MTSYASHSAERFSQRFPGLCRAINATFIAGGAALLVTGLAAWQNLAPLAILVFLALYLLQNVRRPMGVALISDQIDHRVMASGLSVESQFVTLLMVVLAPILGAITDGLGVGAALACFGVGMLLLTLLVQVRESEVKCQVG